MPRDAPNTNGDYPSRSPSDEKVVVYINETRSIEESLNNIQKLLEKVVDLLDKPL